jgi:hypothetical protein
MDITLSKTFSTDMAHTRYKYAHCWLELVAEGSKRSHCSSCGYSPAGGSLRSRGIKKEVVDS